MVREVLSDREEQVLAVLVRAHVDTGAPVGSSTLLERERLEKEYQELQEWDAVTIAVDKSTQFVWNFFRIGILQWLFFNTPQPPFLSKKLFVGAENLILSVSKQLETCKNLGRAAGNTGDCFDELS